MQNPIYILLDTQCLQKNLLLYVNKMIMMMLQVNVILVIFLKVKPNNLLYMEIEKKNDQQLYQMWGRKYSKLFFKVT